MNFFNFLPNDESLIKDVGRCTMTPAQRELFNGFDEIGGDISKYADAVDWFEECSNKKEAIVICMVILSKPTSYLFGGIKNEDKKKFQELIEQIKAKTSNISDLSEDAAKKVEFFIKMAIDQCPIAKLEDGAVRFSGEMKATLDEKLMRSMPVFSTSEIQSFDDDQLQRMIEVRKWWKGSFKLVNVSRMKRLALLYLEMAPQNHMPIQAKKWINNHRGRPSRATNFGNNEETTRILKEDIGQLMADKEMWKKYKKIFSHELVDTDLDGEPDELTNDQDEFKVVMGGEMNYKVGQFTFGQGQGAELRESLIGLESDPFESTTL
jgi:hypothetical protein